MSKLSERIEGILEQVGALRDYMGAETAAYISMNDCGKLLTCIYSDLDSALLDEAIYSERDHRYTHMPGESRSANGKMILVEWHGERVTSIAFAPPGANDPPPQQDPISAEEVRANEPDALFASEPDEGPNE